MKILRDAKRRKFNYSIKIFLLSSSTTLMMMMIVILCVIEKRQDLTNRIMKLDGSRILKDGKFNQFVLYFLINIYSEVIDQMRRER